MKRIIPFILLLSILLSFAACKKEEPPKAVTPDMLNITNNEKSFRGISDRYKAVMSAVESKITILEKDNNLSIQLQNPDRYFLDKDYILTSFSPFSSKFFKLTDYFSEELNPTSASDVYKPYANNKAVIYTSEDGIYKLQFVNEDITDIIMVRYNIKKDSFNYTYSQDGPDGEKIIEFLEFVTIDETTYAVQNNQSRLTVSFDQEGNIDTLYCSTLKNEKYTEKNSIYDTTFMITGPTYRSWVVSGDESNFSVIYEFKDDILTHKEERDGEIAEVSISNSAHASAFYK